jgi:hypothetical protein
MATSFLNSEGTTYITEAAQYLEARGLTVEDVGIIPYATKNHGLSTEDGANYPLMGWAFAIKGEDGVPDPAFGHLRVMNWPQDGQPLYNIIHRMDTKTKEKKLNADRPKFVQLFKGEFLYFTLPKSKVCHSPVVMIHEKITSAELATKSMGGIMPCLALSGCWGWGKEGKMGPKIKSVIENLAADCKLLICFDGDIRVNSRIQRAARTLKSWVNSVRPDITTIFLEVPENEHGVGWDDWATGRGAQLGADWMEEIARQGEGISISEFIPPAFLADMFQLETKEIKGKDAPVPCHTLDNYRRLMAHPEFSTLAQDIGGAVYDSEDIEAGGLHEEDIANDIQSWFEKNAYRDTPESVRRQQIKVILESHLRKHRISVPLLLLAQQPQVTQDQARAAAKRLITCGIEVLGPMSQEDTITTLIRCFRDMVSLWSLDTDVDPPWALALVGPTGCGKSNFPHSVLKCFEKWGYRPTVAKLAKSGNRAKLDELNRACRDSMVGVFDEYNPEDSSAREVEQNIFTLSSTRVSKQRELHKDHASDCFRHASLFLTTTDKNRNYIRSAKGEGERRFITLEVKGVKEFDGHLSSDREIIDECAETLLVYGYHLFLEGDRTDATEFSRATTIDYISAPTIFVRMGQFWARADLGAVLKKFGETYYREQTGDTRFSLPILFDALMPQEKLNRQEKADLKDLVMDLGAKCMGKARVNGPQGPSKEITKDEAWAVKDWDAWCLGFMSKI